MSDETNETNKNYPFQLIKEKGTPIKNDNYGYSDSNELLDLVWNSSNENDKEIWHRR